MRRAARVAMVPVVLALVAGTALSGRESPAPSRTRSFSIDGRRFAVGDPDVDSARLLELELAGRGVAALPAPADAAPPPAGGAVEPLREDRADADAPALPRGLEREHFMRLETATGPVDIAFGRVACGVRELQGRLRSSGWQLRTPETPGPSCVAALLTKGKESCLVLLDTREERFLAVRRAAR